MATIRDERYELPVQMRMLVRHQWIREHGSPRVTAIVGSVARGRALWAEWLGLRGRDDGAVHAPRAGAGSPWLERTARLAYEAATAEPRRPIAIVVGAETIGAWLRGGDDRLRAWVREGIVEIGAATTAAEPRAPRRREARGDRARSLAELTLFEALEATPATAGRFALNQRIAVRFGSNDAEIDLLSREDAIAIEVDGFHHFTDPDHYRRDRRKDALLQLHGLTVLRVLAEDVLSDPRDAVRAVVEVLGHRRRKDQDSRRNR